MGNVSKLNKKEFENKFDEVYEDHVAKNTLTKDKKTLWSFYHDITVGDVIIVRRGTKKIIGTGTVTGEPFYDEIKGRERVASPTQHAYSNFIPVKWEEKDIQFDKVAFSFYTLYEIPEKKYIDLMQGRLPSSEADEDDQELEVQSAEFVLEKYLEDFIVSNFKKIFKNKLTLYQDPEGTIGLQYPVINSDGKILGRIDILARYSDDKSFVVIELKKGRESDKVVGQILRYIGWVKENLCQEGEEVKGIIISKEVDESMIYALSMVQHLIKIKLYQIDFKLLDLGE